MNRFKDRFLAGWLAALFAAQLLYSVGFTWLYIPVVLATLATLLPAPALFRSRIARLIVAVLVLFGLLQVAAVIQFFVAQHSGFNTLSVITTLLVAVVVTYASRWRKAGKAPWVTLTDVTALGAAACFSVVFLLLFAGGSSLAKIGELGAIQSTDGISHYSAIHEMTESQHFNYRRAYYPMGFHISVAFTEDALHLADTQHGWAANARMYIAQYLLSGILLAYVLCYMVRAFLEGLRAKARAVLVTATLAAAVPLILFYLLPFVYQGFLNYYYVCAAAIVSLLYLYEFYRRWEERRAGRALPAETQWFLLMYLLLVFSVSMSWPLLAPPLLLAPLCCIVVPGVSWRASVREWLNRPALLIACGLLLQLVPIYLQLAYGKLDAQHGINALGSIRQFHFGVVIAGIALVTYLIASNKIEDNFKRLVNSTFLPFFAFLGVLIALQYFTAGELRYYAIKSSFLVEMMIIALAAACLAHVLARSALGRLQAGIIAPTVMVMTLLLAIGLTGNPLKSLREMYRNFSHFGAPVFYKEDIRLLTGLAAEGKIDNANSTVLHYDAVSGHYFGNMFIPNWVNVLKYRDRPDADTKNCTSDLLPAATYIETSELQQAALKATVHRCVTAARKADITYYIITDEASSRQVRELFPDATVVY